MAARSNAISEMTRFWLQARHGCLVDESVAVKVPGGNSDIDLVAMRPDGGRIALPDATILGPRVIVETKDEHDWDSSGGEFGANLRSDVVKMGDLLFVPKW